MISHLLAFSFAQFALAQQYILTPKISQDVGFFSSIASMYNLNILASFDDLHFYTTEHLNMVAHRNVLSEFFDVEEDVQIKLNYQQSPITSFYEKEVPWHLARVTQKSLPLENSFRYSTPGSCHTDHSVDVHSYIVDTGIDISHPQFEKRASWAGNFVDDVDTDCNNHGTHVAGLVGSRDYGVCVDAKLFAVKVLDCQGSGSLSGVIRGIEWVYRQHQNHTMMANNSRTIKSVINMSLGGGYSAALNRAVEACVANEQNFYVVVAAGNENSNSCKTSPASVKNILTVMASSRDDSRAWFSNWGSCSDIYAPGVDVLSTIPDGQTAKYSGTSMASPVMAGVLVHYLHMYPTQNMSEIMQTIVSKGNRKTIRGDKPNTKNVLVYLEHN